MTFRFECRFQIWFYIYQIYSIFGLDRLCQTFL
jgi:hypothetical protein